MGSSVAGKIRIDLLANTAQFNAGMREAGRGLGSFEEQAASVNRKGNTQKAIAESIGREKDAWKSAMTDARKEMEASYGKNRYDTLAYNSLSRMNRTRDLAQERSIRLKSYSPWGMSTYSALSTDQAEMSARLGRDERSGSMRFGGVGGDGRFGRFGLRTAMRQAGMGPLSGLSGLAGDISGATAGMGLFAAAVALSYKAATGLGTEIKQIREEAIGLGMTYDELAKKRGLTEVGRFTEGAALGAAGASETSWDWVKRKGAAAFGGIATGVDYTVAAGQWALGGGFNPGSQSAIAETARMDEREALRAKKEKDPAEKWGKAQAGISALQDKVNGLGKTTEEIARADWIAKFSPTEDQIAKWDELTTMLDRPFADEIKRLEDSKGGGDKFDAIKRDRMKRNKWSGGDQESFDNMRRSQLDAGAAERERDDPKAKFQERWQELNRLYGTEKENQADLEKYRKEALRDYYKEAFGLEAKRLEESLKTPFEKYGEDKKTREGAVRSGVIGRDLADRANARDRDDLRRGLGIKDPLGDFERSLKDLRTGLKSGVITQGEYDTRRDELQKSAVSEMMTDNGVSPIGAMQRGGREAHSLIANAMVASPQLVEAKKTNAILEKIEANLRNREPAAAGEALDF